MKAIKGMVKNGQIALAEPVTWPEGTQVCIKPVPDVSETHEHGDFGMSEEEQGDDPESIARWILEFDAIPPLDMTPEEEAGWQAARNAHV